jgi:hypothetical protein
MRSRPVCGSAILALAAVSFACSNKATTPPLDYLVTYEVTGSAGSHFDSTTYDDGHGTLIKVTTPSSGWLVSFNVASGGSVEAHAWGTDSAGSQWAKLKGTWTPSAGSTVSDSSVAASSGNGSGTFALSVNKRRLP